MLTWLTEPELEDGSVLLGSIATRPGRIALRGAAAARGSVEGAGGARIADLDEKVRRAIKAFIAAVIRTILKRSGRGVAQ